MTSVGKVLEDIVLSEVKKPADRLPKKTGAVTVDGISVTVEPERLADWEIVEGLADLQDKGIQPGARMASTVRVLRAVLGADYERVKLELRAANDGTLTADMMSDFLRRVFEGVNPNS